MAVCPDTCADSSCFENCASSFSDGVDCKSKNDFKEDIEAEISVLSDSEKHTCLEHKLDLLASSLSTPEEKSSDCFLRRRRLRSFKTEADLRLLDNEEDCETATQSDLDNITSYQCSTNRNSVSSFSSGAYDEIIDRQSEAIYSEILPENISKVPPLPPRPQRLQRFATTSEPSTSSFPKISETIAAFRKRIKSAPSKQSRQADDNELEPLRQEIPKSSSFSKTFQRIRSLFRIVKKSKETESVCVHENTLGDTNDTPDPEDRNELVNQIDDDDIVNLNDSAIAWLPLPQEIQDAFERDKQHLREICSENNVISVDILEIPTVNTMTPHEEDHYMPMKSIDSVQSFIEDIYVEVSPKRICVI